MWSSKAAPLETQKEAATDIKYLRKYGCDYLKNLSLWDSFDSYEAWLADARSKGAQAVNRYTYQDYATSTFSCLGFDEGEEYAFFERRGDGRRERVPVTQRTAATSSPCFRPAAGRLMSFSSRDAYGGTAALPSW